MEIRFSKQALKTLGALDKITQLRIKQGIDNLPQKIGDIKPLRGKKNYYRLRIGKYRVIYHYAAEGGYEILFVDQIGARGDIYK